MVDKAIKRNNVYLLRKIKVYLESNKTNQKTEMDFDVGEEVNYYAYVQHAYVATPWLTNHGEELRFRVDAEFKQI